MKQPPWKFRLIEEMKMANSFLDDIFENPLAARRLENKLNWMIGFVRAKSEGEWEHYLKAAEDILSQPAETYGRRIVQLERAREEIHRIINNSITNGWKEALESRNPTVRKLVMEGKEISL